MGLDGVEIVMAVEKAFDLPLADDEVMRVRTPGQLIDLIMAKVAHADTTVCLTQRAFYQVRSWLMQNFSLKRNQITPATDLSALIPKSRRSDFIRCLASDFNTGPLPSLVRPVWLKSILLGIVVLSAIAAAITFLSGPGGLWVVPMGASVITVGWLCVFATRPFKTAFAPSISRVSDLAQWVMAHKPDLAVPTQPGWTREQVSACIRGIVIEILACESNYREDALFVEDLGMY